jgi:hypothetical protein
MNFSARKAELILTQIKFHSIYLNPVQIKGR